jgi:hypothetical protein
MSEQTKVQDKYDLAISYLLNVDPKHFRQEIYTAWCYPELDQDEHPSHCLFQAVTKDGRQDYSKCSGCLTQIRDSHYCKAPTPELTKRIRKDLRIPTDVEEIQQDKEVLEVFADYQREFDRTIRNLHQEQK